jgi:hypothetical protein
MYMWITFEIMNLRKRYPGYVRTDQQSVPLQSSHNHDGGLAELKSTAIRGQLTGDRGQQDLFCLPLYRQQQAVRVAQPRSTKSAGTDGKKEKAPPTGGAILVGLVS